MENNKQQKEITLTDIAELIKQTRIDLEVKIISSADETRKDLEAKIVSSADETRKILELKIDSSADYLATISQNQFLELGEKIDKVEKKLGNIEAELNKKIEKVDYNTLAYRVEKLEKKFA